MGDSGIVGENMPTDLQSTLVLLGRLIFGGGFLVLGIRNLWAIERLAGVQLTRGLPQPRLVIMTGIAIQIVGAAMVATGILASYVPMVLIALILLAACLFHAPL